MSGSLLADYTEALTPFVDNNVLRELPDEDVITAPSPYAGPYDNVFDIRTRMYKVNFETINKNIACYPSETIIKDNKLGYIKKYYLGGDKTITLDVSIIAATQSKLIISGSTGYSKNLVKYVTIDGNKILTSYGEE